MADQVVAYSLGPFSFGADSPIGGFLGFANGLSNNYAAGMHVASTNPTVADAIIANQYVPPGAVAAAYNAPVSSNPFVAFGNAAGGFVGAGTTGIGTIAGSAGSAAAPGVAQGASGVAGGIANVGGAGLLGGLKGAVTGGLAGISTGLGSPNLGGGGGGSGFLIVAAGIGLLLVFLLLT